MASLKEEGLPQLLSVQLGALKHVRDDALLAAAPRV
jgi:hypothetical protein